MGAVVLTARRPRRSTRPSAFGCRPSVGVAAGLSLDAGIPGIPCSRIATHTHAEEGASGVTEPGLGTSDELAAVQRQQKIVQWALPPITGVLIVLGAQQGEQRRPAAGRLDRFRR